VKIVVEKAKIVVTNEKIVVEIAKTIVTNMILYR